MEPDVLSKEEVESLLKAIEVQQTKKPPKPKQPVVSQRLRGQSLAPRLQREPIQPYDFKRPERVGQEQMRALQSLHEGLARNFAASLSAMLRTIVEVKLTSIDQLTYSEFILSLESPTHFNVLSASPLEGNLILDISPTILYPVIDRLLGGGKDTEPVVRRPLTEIELRLVARVTQQFLKELSRVWENVLPIQPQIERVEHNPQIVQIVPPSEVVVVIGFEVILGSVRGLMSLCIPYNAIERISQKLTSNSWTGYRKSPATRETTAKLSRLLDKARVELVVTLAETRITTADLLSLRVGDIITTEQDIHTPLVVSVQGVPKFRASPGAYKGRIAVQIMDTIVETKKAG
jgi:flagellar motor switch protein FliM